ncbi:hypothetical protein [Streptomyces sp. bgisy034]|uniref:hypothetical protein n=1 Tax=Streptomyces sp. bgisy034 TaxID=3413774 RepID=UPI003EC12712
MGQVFLSRTASGRPAREIAGSDQVRSLWTVSVVGFSPAGHRPQWLATQYVAAPCLADRVAPTARCLHWF